MKPTPESADHWRRVLRPQAETQSERTASIAASIAGDVAAFDHDREQRSARDEGAAHFAAALRHSDQVRGITRELPGRTTPILSEAERAADERIARQVAAEINQEIGARRARTEMARQTPQPAGTSVRRQQDQFLRRALAGIQPGQSIPLPFRFER